MQALKTDIPKNIFNDLKSLCGDTHNEKLNSPSILSAKTAYSAQPDRNLDLHKNLSKIRGMKDEYE